jgi:hypothetical protein
MQLLLYMGVGGAGEVSCCLQSAQTQQVVSFEQRPLMELSTTTA